MPSDDLMPTNPATSHDDDVSRVGSFYPWPLPDDAVREALMRAFADGSWGSYHGPHSDRLRKRLSAMHDVEHVSLCCTGTIAVELALRGLKVAAGDEVILAGYDFAGNFRAIEAIGARPVLVDIDPRTWCLDHSHLASAVRRQARAIVVSHLHGGMAAMPEIMVFAAEHGLAVVEDACQSPGAIVDGRIAGAWGDASVLSFGGSKLLTAGRGGAILTRHADVHQRIKVFAQRGNDAFALSELQGAVLLPQLERLDDRNRQRRASIQRILAATTGHRTLQPIQNRHDANPSFYKLAWLYFGEQTKGGRTREQFLAAAQAERIPLDSGFRGFALRSSRRCHVAGELTHSAQAAARTVVLHHPVLLADETEVDRIVDKLVDLL